MTRLEKEMTLAALCTCIIIVFGDKAVMGVVAAILMLG